MHFIKTNIPVANLKMLNDKGEELSLSGDDSVGAMPHYSRLSLALFDTQNNMIKEQFGVTEESFLKSLAEFLGYSISKNPDDGKENK